MKKEWYVVNTVSGYEYKVKEKLEMMIKNSSEIQEKIFRVIVPEQTIVEYKDGVKKEKIKKMFPGYVLVEMIMDDEVWFIVRNTQGVTGFIGSSGKGAKPIPLLPEEVERILNNMGMSRIDLSKDLVEGKKVKIISAGGGSDPSPGQGCKCGRRGSGFVGCLKKLPVHHKKIG